MQIVKVFGVVGYAVMVCLVLVARRLLSSPNEARVRFAVLVLTYVGGVPPRIDRPNVSPQQ